MIRIKTHKVLERTGEITFKWLLFLTVLPRTQYLEFNRKSMVDLFCKNCKLLLGANFFWKKPNFFWKKARHKCQTVLPVRKKKQFLYYFTYLYIILNDFINCPAFVDIKLCIKEQQQSKHKQIETFIFYALFLMFASYFFAG